MLRDIPLGKSLLSAHRRMKCEATKNATVETTRLSMARTV
jgi:hypothetical protein